MNGRQFRKTFNRVCDDYGLSAENRKLAWRSCFNSKWNPIPRAIRTYLILAATRTPYRPVR